MEIQQFQDYRAQDSGKHSKGEAIALSWEDLTHPMNAAFATGNYQAEQLLTMLANNASPDQVANWLTQGPMAPLAMAPNATAGGSLEDYAAPPRPRPPDPYPGINVGDGLYVPNDPVTGEPPGR